LKGKKRPEIIEEAGPPPVTENLTPFGIGMEARKLRGACRRTRTLPPKEIRSTSTEKEAEPLDSPIAASLPVPGHLSPLPSSSSSASASASASARGRVYIRRRRLLLLGWSSLHRRTGGRGVKLAILVSPPVIDRGWRPGRAMAHGLHLIRSYCAGSQ